MEINNVRVIVAVGANVDVINDDDIDIRGCVIEVHDDSIILQDECTRECVTVWSDNISSTYVYLDPEFPVLSIVLK